MTIYRNLTGTGVAIEIRLTSSELFNAYCEHEKTIDRCDIAQMIQELPDEFYSENGITRLDAERNLVAIADEFRRMADNNFSEMQGYMKDAIRRLGRRLGEE